MQHHVTQPHGSPTGRQSLQSTWCESDYSDVTCPATMMTYLIRHMCVKHGHAVVTLWSRSLAARYQDGHAWSRCGHATFKRVLWCFHHMVTLWSPYRVTIWFICGHAMVKLWSRCGCLLKGPERATRGSLREENNMCQAHCRHVCEQTTSS